MNKAALQTAELWPNPHGIGLGATPTTSRRTSFLSGTDRHPVYVDHFVAQGGDTPHVPIVMLHGAFHTGAAYVATPDGREGWGPFMARRGHDVYVADWPGHGQSPPCGPLSELSTLDVAKSMSALVRTIGPAIVLAHSAAGPIAWWIAEHCPDHVAAMVGIAPGPPANLQQSLPADPAAIESLKANPEAGCPVYCPPDRPAVVDLAFIRQFWANSPRFPHACLADYAKTIVPESARILNERFNIGASGLRLQHPEVVAQRPILIVTGDCDLRHPKAADAALAEYLQAEFLWLADAGCQGNGHMQMIEDNSLDVASLISQWLHRRGL